MRKIMYSIIPLLLTATTYVSASPMTTPYLDLTYTTIIGSHGGFSPFYNNDYGYYQGVGIGGGMQFQQHADSAFYWALEGHIYVLTGEYNYDNLLHENNHVISADINGAIGAHIGRRVDLDLKLGLWPRDPLHNPDDSNKSTPYLGLGLGVNLNKNLSIIGDIKSCLVSNSGSIGLRYKM